MRNGSQLCKEAKEGGRACSWSIGNIAAKAAQCLLERFFKVAPSALRAGQGASAIDTAGTCKPSVARFDLLMGGAP